MPKWALLINDIEKKIKLVPMALSCNPSIQEAETTKLEVEGHPWLHRKLKASFSPQRPVSNAKAEPHSQGDFTVPLACTQQEEDCSPVPQAQHSNAISFSGLLTFPFSFGCDWEYPHLHPSKQIKAKAQSATDFPRASVTMFPIELWKLLRFQKSPPIFKCDQDLWKSQLTYSWVKYFS